MKLKKLLRMNVTRDFQRPRNRRNQTGGECQEEKPKPKNTKIPRSNLTKNFRVWLKDPKNNIRTTSKMEMDIEKQGRFSKRCQNSDTFPSLNGG